MVHRTPLYFAAVLTAWAVLAYVGCLLVFFGVIGLGAIFSALHV